MTFESMNTGWMRRALPAALVALLGATTVAQAQQAGHGGHGGGHGKSPELATSAAFDKDGRLWAVTKAVEGGGEYLVVQSTADLGKSWSAPRRIQQQPEAVAANGEARPHIAFGPKGEMYISYTKPIAFPHIGDIRFVRSLDGGKTFTTPITVHANRDVIVHSFESMVVDRAGRIYVTWIDGRDAVAAKARQEAYKGSAVYYAVSSDGGANFRGDYKVADHSCECCRIGLALNADGKPVAMWRHVFAPNIRDHAIATLGENGATGQVERATFDDWHIDACPHHGPSLAFAADGTRHQVWFNGKEEGGGALYARTAPDGVPGKPASLGSAQASHPDVAVNGKLVAVAWKQFDGNGTAILARVSTDNGATWREQELGRTNGESDQPRLVVSPTAIVLVWRTQDEGIRVIPIGRERT